MKVTYFPGCTLRTKAKELDRYARLSAKALDVELCEIENWQCCGGVYTAVQDEIASKLSSVRALIAARNSGEPLVTVCSACHNVIKQTNYAMQTDSEFALRVNNYLSHNTDFTSSYNGETKVLHYLELLRDEVGFDKIRKKAVNSLSNRKIAAYYGCLLLRPSSVMKMDDPENPQIIEDILRTLGAEPVIYPTRNECCGGYVALEDAKSAEKRSRAIFESAVNHGAEMIVTACPLCRYNLIKSGCYIPVVYFTELLAEALGVKEGNDA